MVTQSKKVNNVNNIETNPIVQYWMDAERNATTPEEKKQANITMLAVMKALQFERGQRTKISYKK